MYFTSHLLVGAALGGVVKNPAAGAAVGLISHAVMDAVPHHDYHDVKFGIMDFIIGLGIFAVLLTPRGASVIAGGVAGAFPDIEIVIKQMAPRWPLLYPSHNWLTPHHRLRWPWGFFTQAGIAALALAMVVWL